MFLNLNQVHAGNGEHGPKFIVKVLCDSFAFFFLHINA